MNPAYPTDFINKLELFEFRERTDGSREEVWLDSDRYITCVWFASNEGQIPNTMYFKTLE